MSASRQSRLCQLPPEPAAGRGDAATAPAVAPLPIDNPPGLSAIGYRIGTFTSFRQAMLNRVSSPVPPAAGTPAAGPFASWREGAEGDYHTTFIELWAYLADILTFYQERIANEAFIGTARQRGSSQRLAQLVNYLPAPGSGASGVAAFTIARGASVTVPLGFRIGSRARPGRDAAVFETSTALVARAEHNAIPLSTVAPTNQFAQLTSFDKVFVKPGPPTLELAEELYYTAGRTLFRTLPSLKVSEERIATLPGFTLPRINYRVGTRNIVLEGINTLLAAGDYVLTVENEHTPLEKGSLRQVSAVSVDKASGTTTISWQESDTTSYQQTIDHPVSLYAMRVKASPFGSAAPNWHTLSSTLTMGPPGIPPAVTIEFGASPFTYTNNDGVAEYVTISGGTITAVTITRGANHFTIPLGAILLAPGDSLTVTYSAAPTSIRKLLTSAAAIPPQLPSTASPPYANWDDPNPANPFQYVPRIGAIALDAVYDSVRATPDNPGWIVLLSGEGAGAVSAILRFSQAEPVALIDYAMSARVTRVTLATPLTENFRIRDTVILAGAERLALHNDLPLPDPLAGDTLILAGLYPNLQDAQLVIVSGPVFGGSGTGDPAGQSASEMGRLVGPPQQDSENNLTTVRLRSSLANRYVRSATLLFANVVEVTQGETIRDEVLGSSNGGALQSFSLKKQPLTYLPSSDPQSTSPVQSTLTVTVNGVQWLEQPTLYDSGPAAQDFTVLRTSAGQPVVAFGDGNNGMRPPTGVDNVHARYRVGLGSAGDVPAAGVQQLLDSLAGVQQVTNPLPTIGGTDPENLSGIRANAPASVRSFDRAISTEDYAALALTFPGIAKASARWVLYDANLAALSHPYIQLTVAATDGTPIAQGSLLANLRGFLNQRRDPNVTLRILDFTRVYIDFAVVIDLDDRVFRQPTLANVQAALSPGLNQDGTAGYFSFAQLDFGESLHLSAIYAFMQNIPGVRDARVTRFRRMDQDANNPTMVRSDILISPTEIAVIGNDPARPELGLLAVSLGSGGLVGT